MRDSFINRYWRGQGRLWTVYWLYGVLGSTLLAAIYLALLPQRADVPWLYALMLLAFAAYTVWILVSVWRCAFNVENTFYGHLARGLTIAWAINATMIVVFLELDLLRFYWG